LFTADWTTTSADGDLVDRARSDREAFAQLYRRHYDAIAGYVYRRVGDAHVTEDLVADVFLAMVRWLPRYRRRGVPFRAWLYRIATNAVNRWARTQRKRAMQSLSSEPALPATTKVAEGNGAVDLEQARRVMLSLSPKHQTVLSLHYLEGLPVEEVATVLGCRTGTVKSRLSRAREALRGKLEQRR
jgi:RNA polymerase sigma-70 factor (ECF subfamily)